MSDDPNTPPASDPPSDTPPPSDPPADPPAGDPPTEPPGDPDGLGDAGKKALDSERAARKKAEKERKELEDRLAKFERDQMGDQDRAIAEARDAARTEVLAEVRDRELAVAVVTAAAGKIHNPRDAVALLDLTDLDPDDNDGIDAAVSKLLEDKPYLAATAPTPTPPKPPGPGDQGPRPPADGKRLEDMTPEEVHDWMEKQGSF